MIPTRKIRSLKLRSAADPSRAAHLAAASGLVRAGRFLYVIADDEHHLGRFAVGKKTRGELIRLLPGTLPAKTKPRKAAKPDFEALVLLPAFNDFPFGALLALGSGSRPNRQTGVLLGLDEKGRVITEPSLFDFADLYRCLRIHIGELNIEGAVVMGDRIRLLQRGNKGSVNRVIEFELAPLLSALASSRPARLKLALTIRTFDLGVIQGVPLCFSDAAALPNGDMVFTAVAEDTGNSYDDGCCVGSAVGVIGQDGGVVCIKPLDKPLKVEGVDVRVDETGEKRGRIRLRLVTDGDDATVAAMLLRSVLRIE